MRSLSIAGVVALTLCGLCGSARAQRYTFHDYGQSDGLKNLNTRCFLQDTIGFLWVCTEDGPFRFDGSSFERMPMDSRDATYVTGITQDAAGRSPSHTQSRTAGSGWDAVWAFASSQTTWFAFMAKAMVFRRNSGAWLSLIRPDASGFVVSIASTGSSRAHNNSLQPTLGCLCSPSGYAIRPSL
jgi:ligand-binding sensor domain-containing protein